MRLARERDEREAAERRQAERDHLAREKEQAEQAERYKKEQVAHDHEQVLAYLKLNAKSTTPLKDIYWQPPLPATSPDGKQKGTLYHLKGRRRIVNADLKP